MESDSGRCLQQTHSHPCTKASAHNTDSQHIPGCSTPTRKEREKRRKSRREKRRESRRKRRSPIPGGPTDLLLQHRMNRLSTAFGSLLHPGSPNISLASSSTHPVLCAWLLTAHSQKNYPTEGTPWKTA